MAAGPSSLKATPLLVEADRKAAPRSEFGGRRLVAQYSASPSGIDSNLLIFFHGLGDTSRPFFELGKSLQKTLPQTAVLSVQGSEKIPILPEEAWCYWQCIDPVMGAVIPHQNPSAFLSVMGSLLDHLVDDCGWPAEAIHLFGFAHGATAALEGAIAWLRKRRAATSSVAKQGSSTERLGSIVSICGSLLSLPTFDTPLPTLVLHWHRTDPRELAKLKRAFAHVQDSPVQVQNRSSPPSSMPSSKPEWDPIMQFWSRVLRNRSAWERSGDVYTLDAS
ncbi:unnamed protein product [Parajaminaea phylloscopi]